MLNTYKDCKASFCSSLSVSHLSKRTFLLFFIIFILLHLSECFFLSFLFLKSPPSASLFLCFSFLPLLSSLVSTCHPHAAEFRVTGHSFPSLNLGLFLRFPLTLQTLCTHINRKKPTHSRAFKVYFISKFELISSATS